MASEDISCSGDDTWSEKQSQVGGKPCEKLRMKLEAAFAHSRRPWLPSGTPPSPRAVLRGGRCYLLLENPLSLWPENFAFSQLGLTLSGGWRWYP